MAHVLVISDERYEADLATAVDVIFHMATYVKDWSWSELARAAKLSHTTVYRLGSRDTRFPRWRTFWKLALSVGLRPAFIDARGKEVTPNQIREPVAARRKRRVLQPV